MTPTHVEQPNSENFWAFKLGEKKIIAQLPDGSCALTLTLDELEEDRALFTMWVYHFTDTLTDYLKPNVPIVALKTQSGEPAVTFTLREIKEGCAYVQISGHPSLVQGPHV